MTVSNTKHDHHTTPRYYLKAFRIPNEPAFIWQYQRGKPYNPGTRGDRHNPVKRALKKAGVISDYYGPHEDHLEQREAAATPLIERLRATHTSSALLTTSEKEQLTDYIGLLIKRTTAGEERTTQIWPNVLKNLRPRLERFMAELAYNGRFKDAHTINKILAEYAHGMPPDLRQSTITQPYDQVRKRIIELRWTFLTASDDVFITSDNPVRWPEHEGLGHECAFLNLPISTRITLFAGTTAASTLFGFPQATTDCASTPVTPDQAAILNHLTITGAHQYLYAREASEDLTRSRALQK
jgi:hypothetical protein